LKDLPSWSGSTTRLGRKAGKNNKVKQKRNRDHKRAVEGKMYLNLEYFYYKVYLALKQVYEFLIEPGEGVKPVIYWWKVVAAAVSAALVVGIIHNMIHLLSLRKRRLADFIESLTELAPRERTSQWEKIKSYLDSENSSDWRMAVLEADSIMEKILKKAGYRGESLGKMLKKIKPYQIESLSGLWEAHKIRNRIVHEGAEYALTKEEAQKALGFYEETLKELKYL
jgi:hypothetical protein